MADFAYWPILSNSWIFQYKRFLFSDILSSGATTTFSSISHPGRVSLLKSNISNVTGDGDFYAISCIKCLFNVISGELHHQLWESVIITVFDFRVTDKAILVVADRRDPIQFDAAKLDIITVLTNRSNATIYDLTNYQSERLEAAGRLLDQ